MRLDSTFTAESWGWVMRILIAILLVGVCSVASAAEVWIPESPLRPRPDPVSYCQPSGHYEWRQRVLRRYWVLLPCGRKELWEDVLVQRLWVSDE